MHRFRLRRIAAMIAVLAAFAAAGPALAAGQGPERLTLADSIALALANNPAMKIARSEKDKALWQVNQARARGGFTLGYSFARARTDEPPSWYNNTTTNYPVSYNPVTGELITYPAWPKTYDVYRHQLQLVYPLYSGGRIENSVGLARHGEAAAGQAADAVRQQLAVEVTTAYFTVLQTRNLADVAAQGVGDLEAHLRNVRNHYEAGTVALSDVLQTEVRLANARNNLIKAENAHKLSRYKLNKIIGLPLHNAAVLAEDFGLRPDLPAMDDSIAAALGKRPEMAMARLRLAMAEDKLKIAQGGHLPTVALVATDTRQDTMPGSSKNSVSWLVGVSVQLNVFDNGLTRAEIKAAESGLAAAREQLRQAEDRITLEVCQAYLGVREAIGRIDNNKVAVRQSETDYELAQERYENGVGTNLDVMDAELAKTQARTNYVQAVYDYHISRAQLDKAMGAVR
jgi:outer membrane protein